ncbi:uncharacterized protein LOC121237971 [Juglans microcarpa x Juglans regia]|uniref:uncharacterized protein LOC121237971 n=1 Tax=Juglans microcarpa x Juglans regia TaxID=2249226 RepID=UPI001B7EBF6D|nr:uncharacterized protein LOC121237971 [Juglans microcarpa x Juglans regia]
MIDAPKLDFFESFLQTLAAQSLNGCDDQHNTDILPRLQAYYNNYKVVKIKPLSGQRELWWATTWWVTELGGGAMIYTVVCDAECIKTTKTTCGGRRSLVAGRRYCGGRRILVAGTKLGGGDVRTFLTVAVVHGAVIWGRGTGCSQWEGLLNEGVQAVIRWAVSKRNCFRVDAPPTISHRHQKSWQKSQQPDQVQTGYFNITSKRRNGRIRRESV